jgi:hypothetical protein
MIPTSWSQQDDSLYLRTPHLAKAIALRRNMRAQLRGVPDNRRQNFAHWRCAVTKVRAPLSIDGALSRIAGQLPGAWAEMAKLVGRHESTVRRWGDHDASEQIPLPAAIILDIAYQRAGGVDRPLFDTYALQVGLAEEHVFPTQFELTRRVQALIKEDSEAEQAVLLASLPTATEADRTEAVRQLEDVARVVTNTIALLTSPSTPATEAPS